MWNGVCALNTENITTALDTGDKYGVIGTLNI